MRPLTETEKRILDLVGQGMSSVQIASILDISASTVESHRKNLLLKFDAKNTAQLVKKAIQSKLLNIYQADDETPINPKRNEDEA
jgi:DNA-binding CsgD family transcriptional regulator